jgi:hypothetical protein
LRPSRPTQGLPTSRAYWELKAEQMMNRVFSPDAVIDLDTLPAEAPESRGAGPHRPTAPHASFGGAGPKLVHPATRGPAGSGQQSKHPAPLTTLLLASLGGVGLVGALGAVLLVQQWAGLQRTLSQERNLLLVERLRAFGPASNASNSPAAVATPPAPALDPIQPVAPQRSAEAEALPPPPPEEPWMEQLSDLPPTQGRPPLLRVPVTTRLTAAAPAAVPSQVQPAPGRSPRPAASDRRPSPPPPQLVGLVAAPGRAGSAIFQVGNTSTNVNVGEAIGTSGWSLRAADEESALIERGGEVRRISIISGG